MCVGGRGQGTGAAAASKRRETSEESPKGGRTASFLAFSIAASDAALALADTALAAAAAFSRRLFIVHEAVARATSGGTSGRAWTFRQVRVTGLAADAYFTHASRDRRMETAGSTCRKNLG